MSGDSRDSRLTPDRRAIVLAVSIGGRVVRLGAPEFINIELISFRPDLSGGVACGKRAAPAPVYVTSRADGPTGTDGRAVAVEFLPPEFTRWRAPAGSGGRQ